MKDRLYNTEDPLMAYSYNRLWKLMIDKKINKTTLRREAGITSNAMAKMGKDQPVSIEVLAKICRVLDTSSTKRKAWLDTFEENVRSGNIMDANDAMVMKALVEEIIVNDTGIEIHCKCGVTIEQEYIK